MPVLPSYQIQTNNFNSLPPKKRQELAILHRTKNLLFSKLEKLLDTQVIESDPEPHQSIDPNVSKQVEELSLYIERVESQIKKLKNEVQPPEQPKVNNLLDKP